MDTVDSTEDLAAATLALGSVIGYRRASQADRMAIWDKVERHIIAKCKQPDLEAPLLAAMTLAERNINCPYVLSEENLKEVTEEVFEEHARKKTKGKQTFERAFRALLTIAGMQKSLSGAVRIRLWRILASLAIDDNLCQKAAYRLFVGAWPPKQ